MKQNFVYFQMYVFSLRFFQIFFEILQQITLIGDLKNGCEWITRQKKNIDIRSGEHGSHRVSTIDRSNGNLRKFLI